MDSTGTPVDLTGGTVWFTVNTSNSPSTDSGAVIQKSTSSFTDPTSGVVTFTLSSTDTDITPGTYYYDTQFVAADDSVTSTKRDKFIVISDITRST